MQQYRDTITGDNPDVKREGWRPFKQPHALMYE